MWLFLKIMFLLSLCAASWAQQPEPALPVLKAEPERSKDLQPGWNPKLQLSTNLSFQSSSNVTGQLDGDTVGAGLKVLTGSDYLRDRTEWRNLVRLDLATSKTPNLPTYIKAADAFKYDSVFLYGIERNPKLGPYASVGVETALFRGEDIRPTEVTYITPTGNITARQLDLTDAFRPMTTRQAAGLFYKAKQQGEEKLEFRFGLGAVQVIAEGQLFVTEATDTSVTVTALESYQQVGLEYGMLWTGRINEATSFTLSADFLTPLGTEIASGRECSDCSDLQLTNIEVVANIKNKLTRWLSLVYEYRAVKKPELLNRFQVQNGFVFNIAYDHFKK